MSREDVQQPILFTNATIWTAGKAAFPGEVLVEKGLISTVASGFGQISRDGVRVYNAAGATLMPGLIDGHGHLAFPETPNYLLWALIPPEEHTLITMHNARRVLEAGFTSVVSGGSVKPRLDAVIRDEINSGRIPGPRILASTPEFTVTGGLGDDRRMHVDIQTFCHVVDGAEAFRAAARLYCREGSDLIKVCVSGHPQVPGTRHAPAEATLVTDAELAALVETATAYGKRVAAHARSDEAVRMCLRHGVNILYHCEYSRNETLDLLEEAKDRVVLAPALAPIVRSLEDAEAAGRSAAVESLRRQLELVCDTYQELRKRGLRVMIGGEYGHAHCPHGTNARDIEYFVRFFGYTPAEALTSATRYGADGMNMGDRVGQVREGYIADLLLVRGEPYRDVRVLQEQANMRLIMQAGRIFKEGHSSGSPPETLQAATN